MHRRRFVGTVAACATVAVAGCLGSVSDREAVPAAVERETADEVGYEYRGTEPREDTRTVGPVSVEATSYLSEYTRPVDVPGFGSVDAAVFALVSSPHVRLAGEERNPVADWSGREIAERIQNQYEAFSLGDSLGVRTVDLLDVTADVRSFEGEASLGELGSLDVFLDVGKTSHESDYLLVAGVYPHDVVDLPGGLGSVSAMGATDEGERIDQLIQHVRHDGGDVEIDAGG